MLLRFLVLIYLARGCLIADGLPVDDNGRYSGEDGAVQVELDGISAYLAEEVGITWIGPMTAFSIWRETGVWSQVFFVYDSRIGQNTCTCHAENSALLYDKAKLDIPKTYLRFSVPYLVYTVYGVLFFIGWWLLRIYKKRVTRINSNDSFVKA